MEKFDTKMVDNKRLEIEKQNIRDENEEPEEDIQLMMESQDIDYRRVLSEGNDPNYCNVGQLDDKPYTEPPVYGRVSPHARETIYSLYLQGWTVRDLSVKYGFLPERIQAIVWMRQLYYEEVMPRIDLTTIKLGLEMEMMYSMDFPWVDYGKDLQVMAERDRGVLIQRFRRTEVDIYSTKETEAKMEKILENLPKKKYDLVTEKFIGRGTGGYFVKSWVVYKGHGSERVNKKFKDILNYTSRPHKLPHNIKKKLEKGPRIATKGYGIK